MVPLQYVQAGSGFIRGLALRNKPHLILSWSVPNTALLMRPMIWRVEMIKLKPGCPAHVAKSKLAEWYVKNNVVSHLV